MTVEIRNLPQAKEGQLLPFLLKPRQMAKKALTAVDPRDLHPEHLDPVDNLVKAWA